GDGFFVVNTPFGELLTRDGHFKTDATRKLMTAEGYPVQGFNGDIIIEGTDIASNEFGEIIFGNEIVDKFQLVDVTNKGDLVKIGGGYYRMRENPVGETKDFEGNIYQHSLEQSNADAITEMINMMTLQRNYEASQRVVLTHDNILDKAVNTIGRVG
ncbi:flagellar hook-basal body complex protein, partial [Aduncisulcus paluster]